jgi:hypothetical protein
VKCLSFGNSRIGLCPGRNSCFDFVLTNSFKEFNHVQVIRICNRRCDVRRFDCHGASRWSSMLLRSDGSLLRIGSPSSRGRPTRRHERGEGTTKHPEFLVSAGNGLRCHARDALARMEFGRA